MGSGNTRCRGQSTSQTTSPQLSGPCNSAKYDLVHSRRRLPNYSGPDSAFFRIMTSGKREGEGKEVQPGPIRGPVHPGKCRGFQEGDDSSSPTRAPVVYETVCLDTSRFPAQSISTSEFGVTRKNRQVPCLDRSQSSAAIEASRAISRSPVISFLK